MKRLPRLTVPYFIIPFKQHKALKEALLDRISKTPYNIRQSPDAITEVNIKTDYNTPTFNDPQTHFQRPYCKLFLESAKPEIEKLMSVTDHFANHAMRGRVSNIWFQQYTTNSRHSWHTHVGASWANVYYLELNKDNPPTILKNIFNHEEIITPDVKEGDILTFPALMHHCSPINTSISRKTVIAYNIF